MKKIPYITQQGNRKVLMVDDAPFIMLAGEVHNSNSSSAACMEQVWNRAKELEMNTLLLPVTWELIEPQEGVFDFSLVDGLIQQARRKEGKLGFLWFGSWKNAQCYYAPEWVKADTQRFRRAQVSRGKNFCRLDNFYGMSYTSLSYLCEETKKADALFAAQAPEEFVHYMKEHTSTMVPQIKAAVEAGAESGSWEEVFGEAAEELFSAYYIAGYVNAVAKAGKEAYPFPMTVNCWLDKGEEPGKYPTGGPVSKVLEVWKYCAPEIDFFSADIYIKEFMDVCDEMTRRYQNPLYIPECATHSYAGPRAVYCVGHYHAMCYAPFGFEDMGKEFSASQGFLFGMDTEDPALGTPQNVEEYGWYNRTLQSMMPLLGSKYGTEDLQAVSSERKDQDTLLFGTFGFQVLTDMPMLSRKDGVCLILKESEDTFYILGNGCMLTYFSQNAKKPYVEIFSCEEGFFEAGKWKAERRLNGDEVTILMFETPQLLKLRLHAFD